MTVDPKDFREGDRVRITLEGEVYDILPSGNIRLVFDGELGPTLFTAPAVANAEITRLDPPIKAGDRAINEDGATCSVIHIAGGLAWITHPYDMDPDCIVEVNSLTRISEASE